MIKMSSQFSNSDSKRRFYLIVWYFRKISGMANGLNGLFLKLIKTGNGFLLQKAKQSGTNEY